MKLLVEKDDNYCTMQLGFQNIATIRMSMMMVEAMWGALVVRRSCSFARTIQKSFLFLTAAGGLDHQPPPPPLLL
jgi:hypothetical protein